jgi:hypothetical protein
MKEKTYEVRVTYEGTITCLAEDAEELEEQLWVTHELFGKPYNDALFNAEHVEIEEVEEE